jgi:hypothetical protein
MLFLFSSCSKNDTQFNKGPSRKQQLANFIRYNVARELERDRNLMPCGFGAVMMDQVRMLGISFDCYNEIDIPQARELLVTASTLFLERINSNEEIRPYLKNYPFVPNNIEVIIFFKKIDGSDLELGELQIASIQDGILCYDVQNLQPHLIQTIHKETFEEAVVILKESEKFKAVVNL